MRSDTPGSAGISAEAGYRRERLAARRSRVARAVLALASAACLVAAARGQSVAWLVGAGVAAAGALAVRVPADPERWLRGAGGEAATAAELGGLGRRFVVMHDRSVPGARANLDHVVIGPTGVWVVDSKAFRAPVRAGWRGARAGRERLDFSPVAWEAETVAERLGVDARPVVAVHGDLRPRRGRRVGGIPVLPAGRVARRLRRRRGSARLSRAEVDALASAFDAGFPPMGGRRDRSGRPHRTGWRGEPLSS